MQRLSRSDVAAFLSGRACRSAGLSTSAAAGPSPRRCAVPSALTSCRRTVRGSAFPGRPRTLHASRRGVLAQRYASALRIALSAAEALRPLLSCPLKLHALKFQSRRGPLRGRQSAALNRMSRPGEPAGRGRKAGRHRMCHPRRSVRQRNDVKVPRSGARTASPCPAPDWLSFVA